MKKKYFEDDAVIDKVFAEVFHEAKGMSNNTLARVTSIMKEIKEEFSTNIPESSKERIIEKLQDVLDAINGGDFQDDDDFKKVDGDDD